MWMPRPPDFLCIGAAKSGTTWLHRVLAGSPGYWMPPVKELRYFGHKNRHPEEAARMLALSAALSSQEERRWVSHYAEGVPRDDAWYFGLFAPAGDRITGDVSPAYSTIRPEAIGHAKRCLPEAKIVMIVRNPVERDLSHLVHIAAQRAFGVDKSGAVLDVIADRLQLAGTVDERRAKVFSHYKLSLAERRNLARLLEICGALVGKPVSVNDLPELLGKPITHDAVRDAMSAPIFDRQSKQSVALTRWRDAFGDRFHVFFHDDLAENPESLFSAVVRVLGRECEPPHRSIVEQRANPGISLSWPLDDIRAELRERHAQELDLLESLLGPRVAAWRNQGVTFSHGNSPAL